MLSYKIWLLGWYILLYAERCLLHRGYHGSQIEKKWFEKYMDFCQRAVLYKIIKKSTIEAKLFVKCVQSSGLLHIPLSFSNQLNQTLRTTNSPESKDQYCCQVWLGERGVYSHYNAYWKEILEELFHGFMKHITGTLSMVFICKFTCTF